MGSTKRKILDYSLNLFNERGVSNTSLRDIADSLGISVGNLQYHFKKREDIIESLYFEIVEKMDVVFQPSNENLLKGLFTFPKLTIEILYDYRFFLLDFVTITRNNPKIKKHYSELSKVRTAQFAEISTVLIGQGIFREEKFDKEYQSLYERIEVLSNFWFSSQLIYSESIKKSMLNEYCKIVNHAIFPYLTEEFLQSPQAVDIIL